jgi:hypothetical protein
VPPTASVVVVTSLPAMIHGTDYQQEGATTYCTCNPCVSRMKGVEVDDDTSINVGRVCHNKSCGIQLGQKVIGTKQIY